MDGSGGGGPKPHGSASKRGSLLRVQMPQGRAPQVHPIFDVLTPLRNQMQAQQRQMQPQKPPRRNMAGRQRGQTQNPDASLEKATLTLNPKP